MNGPEKINLVYEHLSQNEIERLKSFEYPNQKSAELLPLDLQGKKFGDIGSGSSTQLAEMVTRRGGQYMALDAKAEMLNARKTSETNDLIQGTILHLPFQNKTFDILHTRFVIMNLRQEQRPMAISELARVGKVNYVMDYDWSTFQPVNELTKNLIANFRAVALMLGSDLEHGKKLKKLVSDTLKLDESNIEERVFNDGPITEYKELMPLARTMADICTRINQKEKSNEFYRIAEIIDKNESPELSKPFLRPNIVAVKF